MKKVSKSFPERSRSRARRLARDQGGAVAVLFALMLVALIGMMALAVDLGKAWNLETEFQHAADACAVAGATQLDGSDGARVRAIDACIIKVAAPLVQNNQRFASDGLGADVTFDTNTAIGANDKTENKDIKFYVTLPISTSLEATSDAEANYIEATVAPRRVDFSFAAVVGAVSSAYPTARAVAGWTSFLCDSPPMFMCNPAEPESGDFNTPFNIDSSCDDVGDGPSCVGRGIAMKTGSGGGNNKLGPGDWGYLSLDIYDPKKNEVTTVSGEKELGEALASVDYDNICTGNKLTTKPGNMTALDRMINVRFDLYWTPGDMTVANLQPAPQALKGLVPNPDGSWDPNVDGCRFNPATMADTGAQWWRPQDQYGVDAGGNVYPAVGGVADGFRDKYLGPGRHTMVDVLPGPGDGISDPHPLSEGMVGGNVPMLGLVDPPIRTMAFPNDYCSYPAADVDPSVAGSVKMGPEGCMPSEGGVHMGSGEWDAQTYLDVYHPDLLVSDLECPVDPLEPLCADLPNEPGLIPDGKLSRWELYNWEKKAEVVNATTTEYPNMPQKGKPRCYKAPAEMGEDLPSPGYLLPESPAIASTLDRRIIVMAVVNCVAWDIKGKMSMDTAGPDHFIAIFLNEPMGLTEKDSLYGEVVDPRGLGISETAVAPNVTREQIHLIE